MGGIRKGTKISQPAKISQVAKFRKLGFLQRLRICSCCTEELKPVHCSFFCGFVIYIYIYIYINVFFHFYFIFYFSKKNCLSHKKKFSVFFNFILFFIIKKKISHGCEFSQPPSSFVANFVLVITFSSELRFRNFWYRWKA